MEWRLYNMCTLISLWIFFCLIIYYLYLLWDLLALPLAQNISTENQFHSISTLEQDLQFLYPFSPTQLHLKSEWYLMFPNTQPCLGLLANQRLIIKLNTHWAWKLEVHNGYLLSLYELGSWHNLYLWRLFWTK